MRKKNYMQCAIRLSIIKSAHTGEKCELSVKIAGRYDMTENKIWNEYIFS